MSLINDALKRATRAQPGSSRTPEAPMQPVEQRRPVGLPVYFTPVLLFIVSGACWFLLKGWDARRQTVFSTPPVSVQAREVANTVTATAAEQPIPANRQFALGDGPTPSTPQSAGPAGSIATTGTEAASSSAAIVDAPQSVALKLQGIFYRPANPSAVINSKTVFIGDMIANGKVKAIDRQSVTIDLGSETKVLTLR